MHFEHLNNKIYGDKEFEAKLHGFKMKAPIAMNEWSPEDDERMTAIAKRRYEEMQAESQKGVPSGS